MDGDTVTAGQPLHSMVAERARQHIASGEWRRGERLPPERQLCRQFGVSRATLRQALGDLERRGLITRQQGRGTFVARPRAQVPMVGIFSIRDAMRALGIPMTTRLLDVEIIEAGRELALDLACLPGDPVVHVERLRIADGDPIVLDTVHLRSDLFPGLESLDLQDRSLYEVIEKDYGRTIAGASETLEPVILTARECRLLEVPPHTTALLTSRITTDTSGTVVALGHVLLRGDRSRYLYKRVVDPASTSDADAAIDGTMRRLDVSAGASDERETAPSRTMGMGATLEQR